jgi:hypothetical protein
MDVLDRLMLIKPLRQPCVCDDASSSSSSFSRATAAPFVAHEKYIPATADVTYGVTPPAVALSVGYRRQTTTPPDDDARRWVDRA